MVEHRIARLMQLGLRQARYVGLAKTLFQACLAATVANLTLLAGSPAAVAQAGALVGASVALLWVLLRGAERPRAARWAATWSIDLSWAAPLHLPRPATSARWWLGPPAYLCKLAASRPGF